METARECEEALKAELGAVDLSTFILSVGTQALCFLGIVPHPETGAQETNLPMARHFIDILGMLRAKTLGNVTPDESRLFETLLFDLRLKFVDACRRSSAASTTSSTT